MICPLGLQNMVISTWQNVDLYGDGTKYNVLAMGIESHKEMHISNGI